MAITQTGTTLRWLWQSGGGQGSVGDGGLAAAGWAEQERQAGARALAGDLGRDRSKAKQIRVLLTGGTVVVAGLQDEHWEVRRNGRLSSRN